MVIENKINEKRNLKREKENKGLQMAFVSIPIMKWTVTNQCPSTHSIIFVRSSQIIAGCEIIR